MFIQMYVVLTIIHNYSVGCDVLCSVHFDLYSNCADMYTQDEKVSFIVTS